MKTYNKPVSTIDVGLYSSRVLTARLTALPNRDHVVRTEKRRRFYIVFVNEVPHSAVEIETGKIFKVRKDRAQATALHFPRGSIWDTEMTIPPDGF